MSLLFKEQDNGNINADHWEMRVRHRGQSGGQNNYKTGGIPSYRVPVLVSEGKTTFISIQAGDKYIMPRADTGKEPIAALIV